MRRLFSIVFIAGCVWIGIEIYTQGTAGAFGGILSRFGSGETETQSTLQRVRSSASGARDRQLDRIERQLGDPSVGLRDDGKARPRD